MQGAGPVGEMDLQTNDAAIFGKSALNDARQQRDIDVSPAHQGDSFLVTQSGLVVEKSGDSGSARALGKGLLALEEGENTAGDFFFFDDYDLIDKFLDHRNRDLAGAAHRNANGNGGIGIERDRL